MSTKSWDTMEGSDWVPDDMAGSLREREFEELARECLVWCEMAYLGNAGERQALQAIRGLLARFAPASTQAKASGPSSGPDEGQANNVGLGRDSGDS